MALQRMILPVALLMAGSLMCDLANGQSRSRRVRKNPTRRLVGQNEPQQAAIGHQIKPERYKLEGPPPWVPYRQTRGLSGRRQPQQAAIGHQIKPERYKVKEPPTWVPQRTIPGAKSSGLRPDLIIKEYKFGGKKIVRVRVVNIGNALAGASKLRLTVRRINGVAVARMTSVAVPAIAANSFLWVSIDATAILPNAVALESTTFRLDADFTNVVMEAKETNNLRWHNLP